MKEIIEWIVKTTNNIGAYIGISGLAVRIIIPAVFVLLLTLIIALCVRRKRKKAKAKAKKTAVTETAVPEKAPVEEPAKETVKEEPALTAQPEVETVETKEVKPVEVKEEPKEEISEPVKEVKKPAVKGKWIIELKNDGEYVAVLQASNGEVMLTSETYTSVDGAKGGIETIIKGVKADAFVIYQDKKGNYYYKLKNATNRLLCVGEIYTTKDQCLKAVESVKRIAEKSPVSDKVFEGAKYVAYVPQQLEIDPAKKGAKGKWKIETTENKKFVARLYASNGQLMLSTEEVASKKTAENAIESVKKNATEGNFIIDKDKFGRFYYKLRNAQKSVICIGESYDRVDACISALESVRRFALTATLEIL